MMGGGRHAARATIRHRTRCGSNPKGDARHLRHCVWCNGRSIAPGERIERNFAAAISSQQRLAPEIPHSAERGARGNPGGSFDGALKAAQDVRRSHRHPETRAPVCEPGVPRAHGATCPTPPTQISTPSPKSSCAPSREPCSATRCLCSIRGTRTRGAPFYRTLSATGPRTRSRVAP